MSPRGRLRATVLSLFVAACAVGCERQTGDAPPPGSIAVGLPPWTIGGARLGMTAAELGRLLGAPSESRTGGGRSTIRWKDISVTFDAGGRAAEVFGDRLTSPSGGTILSRGASEAEAVAQLGPGRPTGLFARSGAGLLSCSQGRPDRARTYEDQTTRYELAFYGDRLASVRLRPR